MDLHKLSLQLMSQIYRQLMKLDPSGPNPTWQQCLSETMGPGLSPLVTGWSHRTWTARSASRR